jgi:isopenicillin-N epimerase
LSSAFGSGFLFVHPRQQKHIQPAIVSWGGSLSGRQPSWKDEFHWLGTRNPAPFFSIKTAIEFFQQPAQQLDDSCEPNQSTFELFRQHAAALLEVARREIPAITGRGIIECDALNQQLPMIAFELPEQTDCELFRDPLMDRLASNHNIETPINSWNGRRLLRVSAHLYNNESDLQTLFAALEQELAKETIA